MSENTEKDPLDEIGDELHELEQLNPDEESIWDDLVNADVAEIIRQAYRKPMKETGVIEVIERDGKKYLTCIDEELGTKQEFEFISLRADAYPVGTQFVIYEPNNEKRFTK
jgi:hypothetical protein